MLPFFSVVCSRDVADTQMMSASCAAPVFFVRKLRCNRNLLNNFSTAPRCTPQFFRMLLRSVMGFRWFARTRSWNVRIISEPVLAFFTDIRPSFSTACPPKIFQLTPQLQNFKGVFTDMRHAAMQLPLHVHCLISVVKITSNIF